MTYCLSGSKGQSSNKDCYGGTKAYGKNACVGGTQACHCTNGTGA
jgi:hypothetical protein